MLLEAQGREREATEALWGAWIGRDGGRSVRGAAHVRAGAGSAARGPVRDGPARRGRICDRGALSRQSAAANGVGSGGALPGVADGDSEGLVRAAELHPEGIRPHDQGLALEDAAVALARAGNRERAAGLVEEGLQVYASLGQSAVRLGSADGFERPGCGPPNADPGVGRRVVGAR